MNLLKRPRDELAPMGHDEDAIPEPHGAFGDVTGDDGSCRRPSGRRKDAAPSSTDVPANAIDGVELDTGAARTAWLTTNPEERLRPHGLWSTIIGARRAWALGHVHRAREVRERCSSALYERVQRFTAARGREQRYAYFCRRVRRARGRGARLWTAPRSSPMTQPGRSSSQRSMNCSTPVDSPVMRSLTSAPRQRAGGGVRGESGARCRNARMSSWWPSPSPSSRNGSRSSGAELVVALALTLHGPV